MSVDAAHTLPATTTGEMTLARQILPAARPAAIGDLELLVDSAIVLGAELRLPVFVQLMRMAQIELLHAAASVDDGVKEARRADEAVR